ncbi:protein-glutamate O-methyltransferase [Pseudoalteromonas sp. YIC-656]|uniref:CheR family methyltransferase n=1 Tax=Pseudoalteromonas pernae TaxID=3118054 RepID=UPI003242D715
MAEFTFTDKDFKNISERVYQACGIVLGPHKREMVYSRLAKRLRQFGFTQFSQYLEYLDGHAGDEFSNFINALTTNLTSFYREKHHFDYLEKVLLPKLLKDNAANRKIRIWSAGCSTGEEPYSIAMSVAKVCPRAGWDIKILATDLDSNVLATAQQGVYNQRQITGIPEPLIKQWFLKSRHGDQLKVKPALQKYITFKRLNLLEPWPMKGQFDVIFCRNVVIYFDKTTKEYLYDQFAQRLTNHGHLFLGHSESMGKDQHQFRNLGRTMYVKAHT